MKILRPIWYIIYLVLITMLLWPVIARPQDRTMFDQTIEDQLRRQQRQMNDMRYEQERQRIEIRQNEIRREIDDYFYRSQEKSRERNR